MIKAKHSNLNKASDGQLGTQWAYKLGQGEKIKDAMKTGFFSPVRDNFLVCDTIRMFEMNGDAVEAYAEMVVVSKTAQDVQVDLVHTMNVDMDTIKKDEPKKPEPQEGEQYIKGDGVVKWHKGKRKFEIFVEGDLVAQADDKQLAEAIAAGTSPIRENNKP